MSEELRKKLELAKKLKKNRPTGEFTDEQVLDFFIQAGGNSRAAADLAGKIPTQFHTRLQKALHRVEKKLKDGQ